MCQGNREKQTSNRRKQAAKLSQLAAKRLSEEVSQKFCVLWPPVGDVLLLIIFEHCFESGSGLKYADNEDDDDGVRF